MLALLLPALFLWTFNLYAQSSLDRTRIIEPVQRDSVYHFEEWVLPATIRVSDGETPWPAAYWHYDAGSAAWKLTPLVPDSLVQAVHALTIRYRVLPLTLKRSYSLRILQPADTSYRAAGAGRAGQVAKKTFTEQDLFGNVQLDKSGSLTRGITVGSNKDLSLESGLRFDLNGKLSENVDILATLTDKSTPIQPDGSTQNLREFDRVFIQMQTPSSRVQLGDVDLHFDQSEFARISRRLQGAQAMTRTSVGNYQGAFSVARGRYKSMKLSGRDGVQGPYRLRGQQGEEFIIVLAGTERVYIDGERMKRGEENDYIIDYGLGEITFTNRQIITEETRITVDFQYINRDFSRSLVAAEGREDSLLGGRLSLSTTVIREADSDNLTNQPSLTEKDIAVLRQAGDQLDQAVVSGADSVGQAARNDFVLYSKVDTTYNGQAYTIYRHIPGANNVYRVRFSRTEAGQGAYRRVGREVNGILYEWVGPGNGDYSASRRLSAPQKHQMVALHSEYRVSKHLQLIGEWAGSDYDQNRFSSLDDGDNFDQAYLAGTRLKNLETPIGTFSGEVKQRYSGKRFRYFDRTRPVEFDRKWNITEDLQTRERITEASASWQPAEATGIEAGFGRISRSDIESRRQEVTLHSAEQGLPQLRYQAEYIDSRDSYSGQDGTWLRQQGNTRYTLNTGWGNLTPLFRFEAENRKQRALSTDTLTNLSLQFYEVGPGMEFNKGAWTLAAGWSYREDRRVLDNALKPSSSGLTQRFRMQYDGGSAFNTQNEVAFRRKNYTRAFEAAGGGRDSRGVFIRSATNYAMKHRFMEGQVLYEANTERKALLQETYIEVGPELGQYTWNDLNNDGVQQVDEFFQELSPNEGRFVKQYIPSDDLYPVIDLHTRLRNTVEPRRWLDARGAGSMLSEVLSHIKLHSMVEVRESNTTRNLSDIYLMRLDKFRNDSTTIDGSLYWQQDLQVFPESSKMDLKIQYNQMRGLSRKAVGVERRFNDGWKLEGSYRIRRYYTARLTLRTGVDRNLNERLTTRNYEIEQQSIRPGLDVLFSRSLQGGVSVSWMRKNDRYPRNPVRVELFKTEMHSRAYLFDRLQASMRVEWRSAAMKGQSSALGLYELTEGAGRGNSWVWSLRGSYRINNLVRASIDYDGRTVRNNSPIQTLRIIVSAVF